MKLQINKEQANILIKRKISLIESKQGITIGLIILIGLSSFIWIFIFTLILYFLFIPLIIVLFLKLSSINKEIADINFKLAGASEKVRTKEFGIEKRQKFDKKTHKLCDKCGYVCQSVSEFCPNCGNKIKKI